MTMLTLLTAITAIVIWQTPTRQPERYLGTAVKVDISTRALLMKLDSGGEKWMAAPRDIEILQVTPGDADLTKATEVTLEAVRAGDRLLVRRSENSGEIIVAAQIVIIRQRDLAERDKAEQADWKSRGISGRVAGVEPGASQVTISTTTRQVATRVTIQVKGNTIQRRYRPGSARFNDARPSSISDIRVGDQLLALGNRSPDGTVLAAEKLVSGSFRYFPATVVSVDPQGQQFVARLADGNRQVEASMAPGSVVRRMRTETFANSAAIPEGFSPISIAGLKPGDAVVIATLEGGEEGANSRLAAIAVITGVEALLKRSAQEQREYLGSWDLKLGEESGDAGGGSQ